MKAWEQTFDSEVLDEAIELIDKVKIIKNDGIEIIGEINDFKVTTYLVYNSPSHASCTCHKMRPCKHEAALIYYLIDHPELYQKELSFEEVFDNVSEENLKEFLLNEFKSNDELKTRFLKQFKGKSIDEKHYRDKLEKVFDTGKGKDFKHHGIYDLDLMEDKLYDFIFDDISTILSAGEYDLALELLGKIAELLNDEIMTTFDSWNNLIDRFMEQFDNLSTSIYVDAEKMDTLYAKMDFIFEIY